MKTISLRMYLMAALLNSGYNLFGMQTIIKIQQHQLNIDAPEFIPRSMSFQDIIENSVQTFYTSSRVHNSVQTFSNPVHFFNVMGFEECMNKEHATLTPNVMHSLYNEVNRKIKTQENMDPFSKNRELMLVNREFIREYHKKNLETPASIHPVIIAQLIIAHNYLVRITFPDAQQQDEILHHAHHRWGLSCTEHPNLNWPLTRF